jgi:hypothetical protein
LCVISHYRKQTKNDLQFLTQNLFTMKTKTFLLICLFLGIGLTQLSAQNGKNGTGTIVFDFYVTLPNMAEFPVICNGVLIDDVTATDFYLPVITHYKDGQLIWMKMKVTNLVLKSTFTGEQFVITGIREKQDLVNMIDYVHYNLSGSSGSRYILHIITDLNNWQILDIKSNCHE